MTIVTLQNAIVALLPFGIIALVLVFVLIAMHKQGRAVIEMLLRIAQSAEWTNVQSSSFPRPTVRGTWRQFPVSLRYGQHQKNAPRRLDLMISAQTDHNIRIQRRFEGFFSNRPLTWFGPPLIDVHQPSASQMWVRGDPQLAERLFADPKLASLFATNLVTRFDVVKIDSNALRVTRSLERPGARFRFDLSSSERIAREIIELAESMVEKLG
jgi:hypothetical protein